MVDRRQHRTAESEDEKPSWRAIRAARRGGGDDDCLRYQHASLRAFERYGILLSRYDYWMLISQIHAGDERNARRIVRLPDPLSVAWLVLHRDTWMVAIFRAGMIRTFYKIGEHLPSPPADDLTAA